MKVSHQPILALTFLIALTLSVSLSAAAKHRKTFRQPEALTTLHLTGGKLLLREVTLSDTATILRLTMQMMQGQKFKMVQGLYLMDDKAQQHKLRWTEGIRLGSETTTPESGETNFTLCFEPMPLSVETFDLLSGDWMPIEMLGIHDASRKSKVPPLNIPKFEAPADWFRTDTVCIRGRFEGYDAKTFDFNSMAIHLRDQFKRDQITYVLNIDPDGHFEKRFVISYPINSGIYVESEKINLDYIPFFVRPGDTCDITVRQQDGRWQCFYNSGASHGVERWLKSNHNLGDIAYNMAYYYDGDLAGVRYAAETTWKDLNSRLAYIIHRDHFSTFEQQLAYASMETAYASGVMEYFMYQSKNKNDTDSIFNDYDLYTPILSRVDYDIPLLMSTTYYKNLINRLHYARPVRSEQEVYPGVVAIPNSRFERAREAMNQRGLQKLTGTTRNTLTVQMCWYEDMQENFDFWRHQQEDMQALKTKEEQEGFTQQALLLDSIWPSAVSYFEHPYVRQKAEEYRAARLARMNKVYDLPQGEAADFVRKLSERFPNRYLILDFWDMGCGPCRSDIQSSKQERKKLAGRDNVKLIFIAGERTKGGDEYYRKYVSQWLDGEEVITLTYPELKKLQELFQFSGFPHYENITPDGKVVRDDLKVSGLDFISEKLKQLRIKLEGI